MTIKRFYMILFVCLIGTSGWAQSFSDSNLPIVVVTTDGNAFIPNEPKIKGSMKIIYVADGQRNYVADQNDPTKLNYNGRIEIETRGSSSDVLVKKQYGFTTLGDDNVSNNNVSLLGMPVENDWILSGLAFDGSLMRDYLSFTLSRKLGQYAPRAKHCELILNGEYRGVYMLVEKIKVDDNRVDINKIEPADNTVPDVTGGYITKADKIAGVDVSAWMMEDNTNFVHEFPKPSAITMAQNSYIQSVFFDLANRAGNASITNGFPTVIDVPSFVDFMLINELGSNVDAYKFSTYFHKDKGGKLRAGPVWDLNLTYGYDLIHWGLNRSFPTVWQFNNGDNIGPKFWLDFFGNSTFKCYLSKRWNALTQPGQPFNQESLNALIDETAYTLAEASVREYERWGSQYSQYLLVANMSTQVDGIKSFIAQRITWMTANLGSFNACSNVSIPPLVISRIDYHPTGSSDNEFIEITNTSNSSVNLTGIYFSNMGFTYQFEANAQLPANGVIQLANKESAFFEQHGYWPFGHFTRNLSNTRQKMTLADAFGNVIDEVEYSNQPPWPNASANGNHLKLIDINLDNRLATSWEASSGTISSTVVGLEATDNSVKIFPNPVEDQFKIESETIITELTIHDAHGKKMETLKPKASTVTLNISSYPKGLYTLTVETGGLVKQHKLLKR
jgi:hypothetical protein